MSPIKRNGNGEYQVNEKFANWSAIVLVLITGGGFGTLGIVQGTDRYTGAQATENIRQQETVNIRLANTSRELEERASILEKRIRDNERGLSMRGGPNDPMMPKVRRLEDKMDGVQRSVTGNTLLLRELKTILEMRNKDK